MDYAYDISGWLDDCLDEMDMREEYENLLKMCEDLLNLFGWPEYTGSDLKLRKIFALLHLGRKEEAGHFFERMILIFTAASKFYEKTGNKKAKKQIDKALDEYEKYLERYFAGMENDEFDFADEELPFN